MAKPRFMSQVVGPHFEGLCRQYAIEVDDDVFGGVPYDVASGTVADPANRTQIEIDVAVFGMSESGARPVISLGEAKWGQGMGTEHLKRLRRARDLLERRGHEVSLAVLACYSGAGFDTELRAAARRGTSCSSTWTACTPTERPLRLPLSLRFELLRDH